MKTFYLASILACFIFIVSFIPVNNATENKQNETELSNSSTKAFDTMMDVVMSPRCMNCHPNGDRPHQGDEARIHNFNVQRGEDGHGMAIAQCSTCHQSENNDYSGVPGAPHWHLAPLSMGWEGLTRTEVAQSMIDPAKNGGRSLSEIEKHLLEDPLVMWAFEPGLTNEGEPRTKPPVSKEDFISAVKNWISTGAEIPSK